MSLTATTTSFVVILPAELPDKTMFACLILSTRYRPRFVFAGAAAAFAVQVTIAVAAGGLLSLLPHRFIQAGAAAAFLGGAVLLWRKRTEKEDGDIAGDSARSGMWPVIWMTFAVVFLAEFGDLTQIMTLSLAARYHDPVSVGIGALTALWLATGLAVTAGWRLLKPMPVAWLTRIAAAIMVILSGTSAAAAAGISIPGF